LDELAGRANMPRVLSVACGHLREAQRSRAVLAGRLGECIAFDQDADSLAVVDREQAHHRVRATQGTVRGLLNGTTLSDFDLIYSAGLYDYLVDSVASRLTAVLYSMLRPGGRLLIANFSPELPDVAYMDVVMDWRLIHRDEARMERLVDQLPHGHRRRLFRNRERTLAYLEVTRDGQFDG
jgi:SAM-dependent methyltransferase